MATPQKAPAGVCRYVLTSDKDKPQEEQTVFVLRYLSQREWCSITDAYAESHAWAYMVLMTALAGWENFGGEEYYSDRAERARNVDRIRPADRIELAAEIYSRSTMTEGQAKN